MPTDIPLKVLICKTKHYTNTNVGLDGTELNVKNLDFILILVDYFALFYQHAGFGHPLKELMESVPKNSMPYDCIDTRVFATRPHISIMEDIHVLSSPTLVIETDKGLFYRHMTDSDDSMKVDLKILDAVAVIHKVHEAPKESRGRRGSAGSGRGIRTQIEFLTLEFSLDYDAKINNNDIRFKMVPILPDDDFGAQRDTFRRSQFSTTNNGVKAMKFVDYNGYPLVLHGAEVRVPKSIYPLDDSKSNTMHVTCNIVTSYEDVLFTVSMITDFLNVDDGANGCAEPMESSFNDNDTERRKPKSVKKKTIQPMQLFLDNMHSNSSNGDLFLELNKHNTTEVR